MPTMANRTYIVDVAGGTATWSRVRILVGQHPVLAEAAVRPVIFYPRGATCQQPWVKGLTVMNNSIYNGWRMEDVWLDK